MPATETNAPFKWCTVYGNLQIMYLVRHSASGGNISLEFELSRHSSGNLYVAIFNSTSISNTTITFNVSWFFNGNQEQSAGAVYFHSLKQ